MTTNRGVDPLFTVTSWTSKCGNSGLPETQHVKILGSFDFPHQTFEERIAANAVFQWDGSCLLDQTHLIPHISGRCILITVKRSVNVNQPAKVFYKYIRLNLSSIEDLPTSCRFAYWYSGVNDWYRHRRVPRSSWARKRAAGLVVSETVDIPLFIAWAEGECRDNLFKYRYIGPPFKDTLKHCWVHLTVFVREYVIDRELAQITQTKIVEPVFNPVLGPVVDADDYPLCYVDKANKCEYDEPLYEAFKINMISICKTDLRYQNFSGFNLGDVAVTPSLVKCLNVRRSMSLRAVLDAVSVDGYFPLVGCMPKVGCLKSNGELRSIYPMHVQYEAVLRRNIAPFKSRYFQVRDVRKDLRNVGFQYSYDVVSCDEAIFPYLMRFAVEFNLVPLFLPLVIYSGQLRMLKSLPSGIFGTSFITEAFVDALLQTLKVSPYFAYIQGDGVLAGVPLEHPLLRQVEDATLNGFSAGRVVRYLKSQTKMRLLRSKHRAIYGLERYAVLWASHNLLGGDLVGLPRPEFRFEGVEYLDWDEKILGRFIKSKGEDPKDWIPDLYGGQRLSVRGNPLDCSVATASGTLDIKLPRVRRLNLRPP